MGRYLQIYDEDIINLQWDQPLRIMCCTCGLVHEITFALNSEAHGIRLCVKRKERSTIMARRKFTLKQKQVLRELDDALQD